MAEPTSQPNVIINIPDTIVTLEWRILVLEKLLEKIVPKVSPDLLIPANLDAIRAIAFETVKNKYPLMNLALVSKAK